MYRASGRSPRARTNCRASRCDRRPGAWFRTRKSPTRCRSNTICGAIFQASDWSCARFSGWCRSTRPTRTTRPPRPITSKLQVQLENQGAEARQLAYRLDGPTGLPIEGAWFANKISPNGFLIPSPVGLRDVAVSFIGPSGPYHQLVGSFSIIDEKVGKPWQDQPLVYIGVDAQYFACVLIPQRPDPTEVNFAQVMPLRVGPVPDVKRLRNRTNFSCRLISEPVTLAASGGKFDGEFQVFAGPKKPGLLELVRPGKPGLLRLVRLGLASRCWRFCTSSTRSCPTTAWRSSCSRCWCARACSRSAASRPWRAEDAGTAAGDEADHRKVQGQPGGPQQGPAGVVRQAQLQPAERLPAGVHPVADLHGLVPLADGRRRAARAPLVRRFHPLVLEPGRARHALEVAGRSCPHVIAGETGWLGPYFNLLPCITIALFIWQQKMFMPPPTDEQAAMQQKIMRS